MALDLDALKAERAAKKETPIATFKGESFTLPRELPFGVFTHLEKIQNEPEKSIEALDFMLDNMLGEDKDRFLALDPTLEDIEALMSGMAEEYGITVGEAEASPSS